ncbi:MAG: type II CRISPR RNA-guided endonuclease Cas9, partial [Spirochaetota bacterium]
EFAEIQKKQSQYLLHKAVDWGKLSELLFYQRPLKQPERGHCWYYEDLPRAYKAQSSSERLRIAQNVLNLSAYDNDGTELSLNNEERLRLYNKLCTHKSMNFNSMRKFLGWPDSRSFNLEQSRKELKGAEICVEMQEEEYFGKVWNTLNLEEQDHYLERIMHFMYAANDEELDKNLQLFRDLGLSEQQCRNLLHYNLPSGTTSMSTALQCEHLQRLLQEFPDDGGATWLQELRQEQQGSEANTLEPRLPYYGAAMKESCYPINQKPGLRADKDERKYGRISNPTVHVALNQLRKVVNDLMERYGLPAEIVLELGRNLKNSKKAREEIENKQKEHGKKNERWNKELRERYGFANPGRDARRKLELYEELAKGSPAAHCPYCGEVLNASNLFSRQNLIEVEHILPFSRTLDNSKANLTLSHTACNRQKGNRSPHEAFAGNSSRWKKITLAIEHLPKNKRDRFLPNAMRRFEENDSFLARQLTDNAYIARKAMQYLKRICPSVQPSNGSITELLCDSWNLNSLLHTGPKQKGKNRNDHRHHAVDAIVIAMVDRS